MRKYHESVYFHFNEIIKGLGNSHETWSIDRCKQGQ